MIVLENPNPNSNTRFMIFSGSTGIQISPDLRVSSGLHGMSEEEIENLAEWLKKKGFFKTELTPELKALAL
jgi:hypothetical protein